MEQQNADFGGEKKQCWLPTQFDQKLGMGVVPLKIIVPYFFFFFNLLDLVITHWNILVLISMRLFFIEKW